MNVADKIAEWLHAQGITTTFGIVGAGNVAIFDAIARLKKTQIVCTHHEQAAVLAACGYFRVSGRISVALITTGAGSTNAITGVVAAYMDSTPLIVISGNESAKYMYARTRVWGVQGYDSSGMVNGYVKYISGRMRSTRNLMPLMEASYFEALKPRRGPVWVDICKDVQNAVV